MSSRTLRDGVTLLGSVFVGIGLVGITHSEALLLALPIFLMVESYTLGRFGPED